MNEIVNILLYTKCSNSARDILIQSGCMSDGKWLTYWTAQSADFVLNAMTTSEASHYHNTT